MTTCVDIAWSRYIPHAPEVPQHAFLWLWQKEALFGGAAGGGKSDALLMGALQYVDVPGYAALILRRTYADLSLPGAIMDRAQQWLRPHSDVHWNDKTKTWTFPSGATITFGYLQSALDKYRYQSAEFQYCVAKGQRVLMGDGSLKPIEQIAVGEKVQTLIGPRAVTATHRVGVRNLASIDTPAGRAVVSDAHPLLTPHGWVSPREQLPTLFGGGGTPAVALQRRYLSQDTPSSSPSLGSPLPSQLAAQAQADMAHRVSSEEEAVLWGSASSRFEGICRGPQPPPSGYAPVTLYGPLLRGVDSLLPACESGKQRVDHVSSPQGCSCGCQVGSHSCGELSRMRSGYVVGSTPLRDAPALQPRSCLRGGGHEPVQTPDHQRSTISHPYTMEVMECSSDDLTDSWVRMAPAGAGEVFDLTVSEASHYILANCVISRNCAFDELTQFPLADYTYLFSRLRKPSEGPLSQVPLRMRAASNPGGRYYQWVTDRFPVMPGDMPLMKEGRIFIPAKLRDNPHIDHDSYVASLQELTPEEKAQLLEGDWTIRAPGPWVFRHEHLDAAFEWGKVLDLQRANGTLAPPVGDAVFFGCDYGEMSHVLIGYPLEGRGWYIAKEITSNKGLPDEDLAPQAVEAAAELGYPVARARYDASKPESQRIFYRKTKELTASDLYAKPSKIAFSKYKRGAILHTRRLLSRSASQRVPLGILAISSAGCPLYKSQMYALQYKPGDTEDIVKEDDHGPDAGFALVAPDAKKQGFGATRMGEEAVS